MSISYERTNNYYVNPYLTSLPVVRQQILYNFPVLHLTEIPFYFYNKTLAIANRNKFYSDLYKIPEIFEEKILYSN